MFHIYKGKRMEEKMEIMNLLQSKQILEYELQSLTYGTVEVRETT